jgi:hypothetical protein
VNYSRMPPRPQAGRNLKPIPEASCAGTKDFQGGFKK